MTTYSYVTSTFLTNSDQMPQSNVSLPIFFVFIFHYPGAKLAPILSVSRLKSHFRYIIRRQIATNSQIVEKPPSPTPPPQPTTSSGALGTKKRRYTRSNTQVIK